MSNLDVIRTNNHNLEEEFACKMHVKPELNRMLVSFQANKTLPEYRWFKYKEGFSATLIQYIFQQLKIPLGTAFDPFAGSGTTLFVASELGFDTVGIELLPIGCEIIKFRRNLLNEEIDLVQESIERWLKTDWANESEIKYFPHLRITSGAFPAETETALGQYLAAVEKESSASTQRLLRFAALCVLEEVSYTRKDGQYLRWDYRSGRGQGKNQFNKGIIKNFSTAISQKLHEISTDLGGSSGVLNLFPHQNKRGTINIIQGSCLTVLPIIETEAFECIVTSPPYCNRYDYTRTYALELALLGMKEDDVRRLRQELISCTVENRDKLELKENFSTELYAQAMKAFDSQEALQAILAYLKQQKEANQLNNSGILRMVRNYFFEMTLIIFECARVLRAGAPFIMVNDNVRYQGANIPVDLILSDIAQQAGFDIEAIWVLPTGKGNSSQQMGTHGREELRKCVYIWRRSTAQLAKQQDL